MRTARNECATCWQACEAEDDDYEVGASIEVLSVKASRQGKVEGEKRSGILMRSRKERQNSDRPGGRRGGGSKKSGPGPGPIHSTHGDTQDRAGRGNEKETGGRGL